MTFFYLEWTPLTSQKSNQHKQTDNFIISSLYSGSFFETTTTNKGRIPFPAGAEGAMKQGQKWSHAHKKWHVVCFKLHSYQFSWR